MEEETSTWNRAPTLVERKRILHKRAHPECHYECDDPVFAAECIPLCMPTVCEAQCECGGPPTLNCDPLQCIVRCPPDQAETDQCPQCETVCKPLHCYPYHFPCSPLCQETQCNWLCKKPRIRPQLHCQAQCEMPACSAVKRTIESEIKWVRPRIEP